MDYVREERKKLDNKQITIIAVCGMLVLLTLVFACSKGCGKESSSTNKTDSSNTFVEFSGNKNQRSGISKYGDKDSDEYSSGDSRSSYSGGHSGGSSGSSSSGSSSDSSDEVEDITILTEADKARMSKVYEEERKNIEKEAAKWLEEKIKEADSPKALEQYKLKANKNFVAGKNARRQKDYKQAIKYFNEVCKDPNSTAVTKYFAISNLMGIAQEMKDLELYFIAVRMNAKLCEKEDLSVLGIEKTHDLFAWANKAEKSLKAQNDRNAYDECVRIKIENSLTKLSQKEAEKLVNKDIALYSNIFKEFFE